MDVNLLKNNYYDLDFWMSSKELRYYQKNAIKVVIEGLAQGNKSILIEMAPGTGKTMVLVTIIQYLFEKGVIRKTLLLTYHRAIADQTIHMIKKYTLLNLGNNLKQGEGNQIIVTTYNNLISDRDLFREYDFVICMDIGYTKNITIEDLFHNNDIYYLAMRDASIQDNTKNYFSGLSPSYTYLIQDYNNMNDKQFIYDFLPKLFIHIGYRDFRIEPNLQNTINPNIDLIPDMIINGKDETLLLEVKTYRSRYVSLVNIDGAIQQILRYRTYIKSSKYVLILLGEINEDIKLKVYEEYGIHLLDISNLIFLCNNNSELIQLLTEQVPYSIMDIKPISITNWDFNRNAIAYLPDKKITLKNTADDLIKRLSICKAGKSNGADQEYELICIDIIKFLFEQEFTQFSTQHKTKDRMFRMDLLCGLKGTTAFWEFLIRHYNTKFIVFEFKNYKAKLSQNLIYITEKYLFNAALRNVAIIISHNGFQENASIAAMGCLKESGKLIFDITNNDILKMINLKVDGKEPSDYLLSKVENLLMSVSK